MPLEIREEKPENCQMDISEFGPNEDLISKMGLI